MYFVLIRVRKRNTFSQNIPKIDDVKIILYQELGARSYKNKPLSFGLESKPCGVSKEKVKLSWMALMIEALHATERLDLIAL